MLSIFNGEERTLGAGASSTTFMRINVNFRQHLRHFKGAKLHVFLCIALHSDSKGWSFPSIATIKRETGYNEETISQAIHELCTMEIDGARVLLAITRTTQKGTFTSNSYLIFPSAAEVEANAAYSPHTREKPYRQKPATGSPSTENQSTKKNHVSKPEPVKTITTTMDGATAPGGGGSPGDCSWKTETYTYLMAIHVTKGINPLTGKRYFDQPLARNAKKVASVPLAVVKQFTEECRRAGLGTGMVLRKCMDYLENPPPPAPAPASHDLAEADLYDDTPILPPAWMVQHGLDAGWDEMDANERYTWSITTYDGQRITTGEPLFDRAMTTQYLPRYTTMLAQLHGGAP